jgi:hypothetical protein
MLFEEIRIWSSQIFHESRFRLYLGLLLFQRIESC